MTTFTVPLDDFDSSTSDGGLGTEVLIDRDRAPLGSFVFGPAYDGTCFIIKDNLLYYCKPKEPETWPALFYIEVGTPQLPGITGVFHNGQPHYFTRNAIYYIQGTGNNLFQPIPLQARTGAQSIRGAVSIAGFGIAHTGPDGIYVFTNGTDKKITEDSLEPLFRGETVNGMSGVGNMDTSWLWHYRSSLYFGYAGVGGSYPTNLICLNLENGKLAYYVFNDGADIQMRSIGTDVTNKRLLIGDATGFVRTIDNVAYTDDSGTAISWEVQSKNFTLPTRAHFPRWVKYDVEVGSATVTGSLILDDSIHHSHTITGSRLIKRRLVGEGNGSTAAVRVSGTGRATVYSVEFE